MDSQVSSTKPQYVSQQQDSCFSVLTMTHQQQQQHWQHSSKPQQRSLSQSSSTTQEIKTNQGSGIVADDTWGPIFKNKEHFVNMHVC